MNFTLIPTDQLNAMRESIEAMKGMVEKLMQERETKLADEWLTSEQARQLLQVSKKTWQGYRDRRLFDFYQNDKKILVKKADILAFIERYRVKKSANIQSL